MSRLMVWLGYSHDRPDSYRPATSADLIAEIRSRVESGTIKGKVVWHCDEGWGHEDGWFCDPAVPIDQLGPNCGYRLLIPVSDGGSET